MKKRRTTKPSKPKSPTREVATEPTAAKMSTQMRAQRRLLDLAGQIEFTEGYDPEEGDNAPTEWTFNPGRKSRSVRHG